jgi:hypothetical protein
MAPEIARNQRPAQYVFDGQVQQTLSEIRANEAREKAAKEAAQARRRARRSHSTFLVIVRQRARAKSRGPMTSSGGRSSIPERSLLNTGNGDYWMPRLRGA